MKISTSILFVLFVFAYSCSKQSQTEVSNSNSLDSLIHIDKKNITSIGVSLSPSTKKEIENWKEYQLVDAVITNFYAISKAEALSNAQELSRLVTNLKDSIRSEKHKNPSIKTRINILQNECLRLEDMSNIPAITPEEVTATVKRTLEAFSGLNAKLNSVYAVSELENELILDPDFLKILNDSINTDDLNFSLSKQNETLKKTSLARPKQGFQDKKHLRKVNKTLRQKK